MKSPDRSVSRSMSSFGTFLVKNKKKNTKPGHCASQAIGGVYGIQIRLQHLEKHFNNLAKQVYF